MSSSPIARFHAEHAALMTHVDHLRDAAAQVPTLSPGDRAQLRGRLVDFLEGTLLPHARAEEAVLYPEWSRLVGYADAAAPMIHDHEAIVTRIQQLAAVDVDDVAALQQLLYGLHALITVHFGKEEQIQLPRFERESDDYLREVFDRMESAAGSAHAHAHG
jgi:iron-sulfur cluster repair protein YtfE (RIC family)